MARNRRQVKRTLSDKIPYVPHVVTFPCHGWPLIQRMSIHQTTTRRWSFPEDVVGIRSLGFQALGAWRFKVDDFGEERAGELAREEGLTISSLSWAGGFAFSDRESFESAMQDAESALQAARFLDAKCLVIVPGTRGSYTPSHASRIIIDALRRLGDLAASSGIQIAVQPIDPTFAGEGAFLNSLDQLLDLLTHCRHQQVGLNLDLFHLRGTPNLTSRFPELLPWIRLVQLSDCLNPVTELDRCPLGDGQLNVQEVVESLESLGYGGFYELAFPSPAIWARGHDDFLRTTRHDFLERLTDLSTPGKETAPLEIRRQ